MYYLAYGSNLNVEQMAYRCPDARIVGTAEIKDYRLLFKGSLTGSYLTIEKAKGFTVPVAVWEVSESDIKSLDRYEGYPSFYYKRQMVLPCSDGKRHRCFVYIMHEERLLGIPSMNYIQTCERGYNSFKFDKYKLYEAIEYSERKLRYKRVKVS